MPRNDLTLSSKIALLNKIKSLPLNTSYRQLSELIGVPKSTLSRLLQQEDKLRDEWALLEGKPGTSKRKREGKNPEVEEALDQWFSLVIGRGVNVTGPILKTKSEELAKKLGHNDFRATDGWLSRWKVRHNIKFKKVHREKCSGNNVNTKDLKSTNIPEDNDSDTDVPSLPVTNREANKFIAGLQRYFMQEGNEGSPLFELNICADYVQLKTTSFIKTETIDEFLQN